MSTGLEISMIGLSFIGVFLFWIGLSIYFGKNIPKWFHWRWQTPISLLLIPAIAVSPFVDEVVGMRQFKKLCEEMTVPRIALGAELVEWGDAVYSKPVLLENYLVDIFSETETYRDVSTGKVFLEYEYFRTKGGRVAGILLMGGWHSCSAAKTPSPYAPRLKALHAYQKIINGIKK